MRIVHLIDVCYRRAGEDWHTAQTKDESEFHVLPSVGMQLTIYNTVKPDYTLLPKLVYRVFCFFSCVGKMTANEGFTDTACPVCSEHITGMTWSIGLGFHSQHRHKILAELETLKMNLSDEKLIMLAAFWKHIPVPHSNSMMGLDDSIDGHMDPILPILVSGSRGDDMSRCVIDSTFTSTEICY